MEDKKYLSQEKYDELKKELNELKTVKRKEIAESLEYAKSLGDLSENAEYQEARESQANMEERIAILEEIIKNAKILSANIKGVISLGANVVVKKSDGEEKKFLIVGSEESDILGNKISNESPLGSALFGKRAGDKVNISTPKGAVEYKIISVE